MGKPRDVERATNLINSDLLRAARHAAGFTQDELGEQVGVTGAMVSLLENGGRAASRTLAVALASTLGVQVDELVIGTKATKPVPVDKVQVGTALVATVENRDGVLHQLTECLAREQLNIRSLSTSTARGKTGNITLIVDPVVGQARERLRKAVESLDNVRSCVLRDLKQPLSAPRPAVMPVTSEGASARGLRLVAVGLPDSPDRVTVAVWANDRIGLMRDLAAIVSNDLELRITAAGSSTDETMAFVWFMIARRGQRLQDMVRNMRGVRGVQQVLVSSTVEADEATA